MYQGDIKMANEFINNVDKSVSDAARQLNKLGASKGGKARWKNTSDAERKEFGAMLAEARRVAKQKRLAAKIDDAETIRNTNSDDCVL